VTNEEKKAWVFVAGFIIVVVLAILGVANMNEPTSQPSDTTAQTPATNEPEKKEGEAKKDEEVKKELDPYATKTFKEFMLNGYGGFGDKELEYSWYNFITDIKVSPNQVGVIKTSLPSNYDEESKSVAKIIANAAILVNLDKKIRLDSVVIKDRNGYVITIKENTINP